jgi:hypothetical protein
LDNCLILKIHSKIFLEYLNFIPNRKKKYYPVIILYFSVGFEPSQLQNSTKLITFLHPQLPKKQSEKIPLNNKKYFNYNFDDFGKQFIILLLKKWKKPWNFFKQFLFYQVFKYLLFFTWLLFSHLSSYVSFGSFGVWLWRVLFWRVFGILRRLLMVFVVFLGNFLLSLNSRDFWEVFRNFLN